MNKGVDLIIAGVGGQGNVKAGQILGLAGLKAGFKVRVSDVFGISQRGGAVVSHVRIGNYVHGPLVMEHGADVIVGLEPMEAMRAALSFARPKCLTLVNTRALHPIEVNMGIYRYPDVCDILSILKSFSEVIALDFSEIAEKACLPIATNIAMLGGLAATGVLPFSKEVLKRAVEEGVPKAIEQNLKAFDLGYAAVNELLR